MMVSNADEIVRIAQDKRIHLAIVDSAETDEQDGVRTIKVLRNHFKSLPCILLAGESPRRLLVEALALNVFTVMKKPVDLSLLADQIDRIFKKYYESDLFESRNEKNVQRISLIKKHGQPISKIIVRWLKKQ